jgi:hypothetical protein
VPNAPSLPLPARLSMQPQYDRLSRDQSATRGRQAALFIRTQYQGSRESH